MADETRQLATFAHDLAYDDIPAHARGLAIDNLVDQIGCQLGVSHLPWSQQVLETYSRVGGSAEASVVRYGQRLPIAAAAFINSTFGHAFEYDDANPFFQGHPGCELIPPLLAVAEHNHQSGRDLLAAFVAGYEVRGRVGWAVSPEMSMHGGPQFSTACGVFGAAASVARLFGLSAAGIENAMGIAGSYAGGLMQYDHGGGSVKRIHGAICASHGIQAAELARAGMTRADRTLAHLARDHRLIGGKRTPASLFQAGAVANTFHCDDNDLGGGIIDQVVDEIANVDVTGISRREIMREADASLHRLHDIVTQTAALRDDPD